MRPAEVGVKQGLFVVGYNRPGYYAQTLCALQCLDGIDEYDVWAYFDAPVDDESRAAQATMSRLFRASFPRGQVVQLPVHGGCDKTLMAVRREMFESNGYARVVQVEDDYVVAPYALRALEAMHAAGVDKFGAGKVVSTLVAWCLESFAWKRERLGVVGRLSKTHPSLLFSMFDAAVYAATVDVMDEYELTFARANPRERNGQAIRAWLGTDVLRTNQLPEHWATGQDGVLSAAMLAAGIESRAPVVNHGTYIGVHGVHSDEAVFSSLGADRMQLDLFPVAVQALANPEWVP